MEKPLSVQGFLVCKINNKWKKRWCELRGENFDVHTADSSKVFFFCDRNFHFTNCAKEIDKENQN